MLIDFTQEKNQYEETEDYENYIFELEQMLKQSFQDFAYNIRDEDAKDLIYWLRFYNKG